MTTPRIPKLNRVFTVTASSERQVSSLIKWRYNNYGTVFGGAIGVWKIALPATGKYGFARGGAIVIAQQNGLLPIQGQGFGAFGDSAQDAIAANITNIQIGANSVNSDGTANTVLPEPQSVLTDTTLDDKEVRLGPVDNFDTNYLRFTATGRGDYPTSADEFREVFQIFVTSSATTLVGDDFTITATTPLFLTVEGQATTTTLSETVTHNGIWGEMDELGIEQAVSIVGTDLTESAQARATLKIRYRADLVDGDSVVDDLGRTWTVTSSRALYDRRFLEYDLQRLIAS